MSNFRLFVCMSASLLALTWVVGCGGAGSSSGGGSGSGGGGGGTQGATSISVTIGPLNPVTMMGGATQNFTATVANDSANAGVAWTVANGGSFSASSTPSGTATVYTAANPVPTVTAVLTATSKTDPTKAASVTVNLAAISLNPISPVTFSLGAGGSQIFTDTVANDALNSGVTWSIGSGPGTLTGVSTTSVTYNAPTTPILSATSVTLIATSVKDPTKSTPATITLNRLSVAVTPANPVAMLGGAAQTFVATVTNDGANAGVIWTVTGGGSFNPSTTASGASTIYTAANPVASTTATLTATSKADPTKSGSMTITLTPIAINLTSASSLTLDGNGLQTLLVSASITGDSTASGATFGVSGAGGVMSASPVGGNSVSSIYTVPVVTSPGTSTITVASVKDPTRTQTVTVMVNPAMSFTTPEGALAAASAGTTYSGAILAVAGGTGNKAFSITVGSLPAGLTMSTSGVISGAATATMGTSNFTVQVVDQSSSPATINGSFSITVGAAPPVWVSPTAGTLTYTVGTAISPIALSATGGTGAITYSVNSGALPPGLLIAGNQVTGTPTSPTAVAGNVVNFLATDSAAPTAATAVSASVTLIANPVALAIISTSLPLGTVGAPYSWQLASTGGTGTIVWSLSSGSLAGTGLTLSNSGLLSGTPTAALTGLGLTFQAKDSATDQQQTRTSSLSLDVYSTLTIIATSWLPTATTNTAYSQSFAAAGGSGSGYTWSVTSGATGANSLANLNLSFSAAGAVSGTPTTAGTANFTVQVKDSSNNTASANFSISTSPMLSLPSPNPSSLGSASITISYTGAINASGGIPGYTWTVNGSLVPANGTLLGLTNGLSVSNSGGGVSLSVSGTPTSTGTITFTASVKDSTGTTVGPLTYTINASNLFTVGGQINSQVGCSTGGLNGVTVTINTNPVQTTTTSANGAFSFSNVPNGTYTITPSINGLSSAFYPATETVTVNSNNLTATSITATLGYTVAGTVAYTGTQNRIYLALNPTGNCGGRSPGTSISAAGDFTIRGVPPGTYTLQAFMDNVGDGVPNAANPVGSAPGVNVTTANVSSISATLTDPAPVTLTTAPTLKAVAGFNTGAIVQYKPITDSTGLEMATYYTLQWSASSTFVTIDGSKRFPANGTHSNLWLLTKLTNGSHFYFRTYGTSGGTLAGPYSTVFGPVTISAPIAGNTVTGTVTFATPPTGPLYVGFYDQSSAAYYGQYFASPNSPQPYSIQVPSGSDYVLLGVVDQNNDGAIDADDITNTGNGSSQPVTAISGPTANQNLTLPSTDGIASVTTQNFQSIVSSVTSQNYGINFQVYGLIKRPVAAALASGPNLIVPVDIAICGGPGSSCTQGFQISFNLYGTSPAVGDSYLFDVTYSDATTGTLTAAVTAVLNAFPTSLSPQTGTSSSITPTFTWIDPVNANNYTYQFYMNDSTGNGIWQIPGIITNSNGFSSATTSIAWGSDPTGGGSNPSVGSLTHGTTYLWQITVQDSNGNSAATQVQYQP